MKKLLFALLTILALTASAYSTDVAIGPTTIPGFQPANLPADVTVTASVTFNSPTVTCASCFRQQWVGLGGFRISIQGVPYTVAFVSSRSSLTLTTNYAAGDNPSATILWYKYVELRIYADSSFQPAGKTYIVQPGAPGSGAWHRRVAASVVNELGINNLYIPQLTLDATTDSLTNQSARYYAAFYRPEGAFIQTYDCFDSFALQPTGSTTWPDICTFNMRQVIVQDDSTYTKTQIDAMRTGCTIGQSLFYAATGLKPDCLNFGAGLSLVGNTLSSSAVGLAYTTVLEEGTPLTQRSFLNFIGSSFTAADNAGASRTEVTADADLNALASNATNGFWAAGTNVARTLTGTANEIAITNGNGTVGAPVWSLPSALTFTGKTMTGGTYAGISALGIRSSGGGAFDLQINNTETLTANRALTFTLNDAARTINLGGNFTTAGANPLTLTTTGSTNVTFPITGTLATLAGTETFSLKTLTSPRIGVALLDTNGNEVIETPATASAVNHVRVTNAATGAAPVISIVGDDTNIAGVFSTKGTGFAFFRTNSIDRLSIHGTNAETYFGNGITNAAPANYSINGTGGSGTNIAGAHLDLAGGKGTGNAAPGQAAVRYPLVGASGTTLQSLSTDRFPVSTSLYTNTTNGNNVVNTTTETSVFTGAGLSAGSTLTLEAGSIAAGTQLPFYADFAYTTTGTPTIRFKLKIGSITIWDSTAFNATTGTGNGRIFIQGYISISTIGATAAVGFDGQGMMMPVASGSGTPIFFVGDLGGTVDLTANQTIDLTVQWGTASPSNNAAMIRAFIGRVR